MKKRTKATVAGTFVIGAIIILIAIIINFAQKESLDPRSSIILFLPGSLKGLAIGSPVEYRGIKVGAVTQIRLRTDPVSNEIIIPVWFQFLRGVVKESVEPHELKRMIQNGLRARLVSSNIVTGEQSIALVMEPNTEIKYHKTDYFEIPTIATETQEVILRETLNAAKNSFNNFSNFLESEKVDNALESTKHAFDDTSKLVKNINNQVDPLTIQISSAIIELQKSAQAFRVLAEYLSRHPEALIQGKHSNS